jgi:hypothetical protein
MPDLKLLTTARELRDRAEKARVKAETLHDPEAQRMMLQIAVTYVEVARRLEGRRAIRRDDLFDFVFAASWFAHPTLCGRPPSRRWHWRPLLKQHVLQLLEIAVIEKPAHHVRRNLACALLVKLVPGHEIKTAIGTGKWSLEASMKKVGGFYHDHASAIRIAVGQPE